jgi:hypothetical protein
MKVSRRDFLKASTAGAAAATMSSGLVNEVLGAPSALSPLNKFPGRVVINFNKNALTGTPAEQTATRMKMVDDAILRLTDQTDVGAAWKSIFPSAATSTTPALTATSKIAIKVPLGCSQGHAVPHVDHILGMVNGLRLMDFGGGVKFTGTITLYESKTAYCSGQPSGFGYTAASTGCTIVYHTSMQNFGDGYNGLAYAPTLNAADFLINVFTPRGHGGQPAPIVTLGIKNHFGAYDPTANHIFSVESINMSGPVFKKQVLCMCSAIYANDAGNGPQQDSTNYSTYVKKMDPSATTLINPCTLILSTDAVSADMQAYKIMAMNKNKGFTETDMPAYLQNAKSIGTINPTDVRTLLTVTTEVNVPGARQGKAISPHVSATHVKGHNSTFIQYALPSDLMGRDISFEIFNTRGSLVCRLSDKAMGALSNISWDERDASGSKVRPGIYLVRLVAGSIQMSTQLSIMR